MQQHPIDNMMQTTMETIRSMVDVNTVVGAEAGRWRPRDFPLRAAQAQACRYSRWVFWWWETAR